MSTTAPYVSSTLPSGAMMRTQRAHLMARTRGRRSESAIQAAPATTSAVEQYVDGLWNLSSLKFTRLIATVLRVFTSTYSCQVTCDSSTSSKLTCMCRQRRPPQRPQRHQLTRPLRHRRQPLLMLRLLCHLIRPLQHPLRGRQMQRASMAC